MHQFQQFRADICWICHPTLFRPSNQSSGCELEQQANYQRPFSTREFVDEDTNERTKEKRSHSGKGKKSRNGGLDLSTLEFDTNLDYVGKKWNDKGIQKIVCSWLSAQSQEMALPERHELTKEQSKGQGQEDVSICGTKGV